MPPFRQLAVTALLTVLGVLAALEIALATSTALLAGIALFGAAGIFYYDRWKLARQAELLREQVRRELDLEAEHKDLIESANDVVFTLDRQNRITSFNCAGERLTGYSRGEVIGRTIVDLSDPLSQSTTIRCSQHGSKTFEIAVKTRMGPTVVLEVSARPARRNGVLAAINCIGRDITQRKKAHEDLRRLTLIQAQQFEHSPLAFIEWDREMRIVRWSRQAERIFGWKSDEVIGKMSAELNWVHADDVERVNSVHAELTTGQVSIACRNRNHTKDRGTVHIEWYNSSLLDENGQLLCVISLAHDVTDRERDEEQRRQLEIQVRQSQKMEAVGQLAGGIAHDFNNLLTVINGCSELLQSPSCDGDSVHDLATEIRGAGEQAATLTRQLLAFARKQITAPCVVDLNDVVRDVEKILRRLIGGHIRLITHLEPDGARVKVDPGSMTQVLINLAVNARDAMPGGGSLRIGTAMAGDRVLLTVADTGAGMDAATQSRVFEPFFTTKAAGEGTGLGLSTVHGIVQQSSGTISFESSPGVGTTFRIELPSCAGRATSRSTAHIRRTELKPREKILLVDDEDLVRSLAQRILESRGYRVFTASCAEEALGLHSEMASKVDLLLTDVVMPGLGGRLLAERLLDAQPSLRVLYMSGYTSDDVLRQEIHEDEVHFIQKPFSPDGLVRQVREILAPSDSKVPA